MEWVQYLILLLCPLMMIFCMKGHIGGHKHHEENDMTKNVNKKIKYLQDENEMLREEILHLLKSEKKES